MANYPIFCSGCGRRLGTVNDPARRLDLYYCADHQAPTVPVTRPSQTPPDESKKAEEKPNKRGGPRENKAALPKENK